MHESLRKLQDTGVTGMLDSAFGEWIAGRGNEVCGLAAALVSAEVGKGHVCLDLDAAAETLQARGITPPKGWREALEQSGVVASPGERAPLVLDGNHLYLHRYWTYETRIADALRQLAAPSGNIDVAALGKALQERFPEAGRGELDRQALAAAIGATRRLTIISGGPGTGKTWTACKLVALALELDRGLKVVLAAPTGKAARRLGDVVAQGAENLSPEQRQRFPDKPLTLHRLLGYNASRQTLRHDASNPLDADLIVVDEASMVDIGLMARLLAALKPDARLVLVGDRNQLASVEAGAVFGDICLAAGGFAADEAARFETALGVPLPRAEGKASPVSGSIALLKRNYRFGAEAIDELARAVVAGNADTALHLLQFAPAAVGEEPNSSSLAPRRGESVPSTPAPRRGEPASSSPSPPWGEFTTSSPSPLWGEGWGEGNGAKPTTYPLTWRPMTNERQLSCELDRITRTWFKPVLEANGPEEALQQLARFRLLAAERRGAFGVEAMNAHIESLLGVRRRDPWYCGRPVLITENDYELGLFNGDYGIIWPTGSDRAMLRIVDEGGLRAISPARLPAHETCYVLTVHKAQGSEFDRVALVLPPHESRVATRELVYTGITRAREAVEVWATESALSVAVTTAIRRASGLAERLD